MGDGKRAIYLARHGRPTVKREGWSTARGFDAWWQRYEAAGLDPELPAPESLKSVGAEADIVFASSLPRAQETAAAVASGKAVIADDVFLEAPLPAPPIPLFLPITMWWALARFYWWLGLSGEYEQRQSVSLRANDAGVRLLKAAEEGDVLLCGHGWFNRMVSKRLQRAGYRLVRDGGDAYWGWRKYERSA